MRLSRESWLRATPFALLAAGLLLTFALWRGFVTERRDRFADAMAARAAELHRGVRERVEDQVRGLRDLALLWGRFGRKPAEEWETDARMLMDRHSGVETLAWVDPGFHEPWVAERGRPPHPIEPDERERLAPLLSDVGPRESEALVGPLRAPDGVVRYRVELPVTEAATGRSLGVLAAIVRPDHTLKPLLDADASRFATTLVWGEAVLLRRGEPWPERLSWWPGERRPVALAQGPVWELRLEPTDALVRAILTPLPGYLLSAGVISSLLLAALAHEMQVARRQARDLERANRELAVRVTQTLDAERALRRLNEELEQRVRARTADLGEAVEQLESFNSWVSHDLRSPLGAILNFAALLEEEGGSALREGGLPLLARIRGSAEAALAMMDGLLELSRLGREALRKEPVDMAQLAREAFEELRAATGAADARLELSPLPPVFADPAMMRIVWTNLLSNALKYSRGREKPWIAVDARAEDGFVTYSVRDNGVGFDMRFADRLFRAFQRLHGSTDFEGSGMGLAIVHRIVQRHGGRVGGESEVERGATFHVSLPGGA